VINFDGNSAAYLQYTFARLHKVLTSDEASDFSIESDLTTDSFSGIELTENEREVLRLIPRFPEAVVQAAEDYKPHFINEYLFKLAQAVNSFYAADPILQAEGKQKELRLAICQATSQIIETGLGLLAGIEVPEEM